MPILILNHCRLQVSVFLVGLHFQTIQNNDAHYHYFQEHADNMFKIYTEQQKKRIFCIFGIVYKWGFKY